MRVITSALIVGCALLFSTPSNAQQTKQYWYYCDDTHLYFPYVQTCRMQWRQVEVTKEMLQDKATPPAQLLRQIPKPKVEEPPAAKPVPRPKVTREIDLPPLNKVPDLAPTASPPPKSPTITDNDEPGTTVWVAQTAPVLPKRNGEAEGIALAIFLLLAVLGALALIVKSAVRNMERKETDLG